MGKMTNQDAEEYKLDIEHPHVPDRKDPEGWAREYSEKIGTDVGRTGNPNPSEKDFAEHPDWPACIKILGKEDTLKIADEAYHNQFARDLAMHFGVIDACVAEDACPACGGEVIACEKEDLSDYPIPYCCDECACLQDLDDFDDIDELHQALEGMGACKILENKQERTETWKGFNWYVEVEHGDGDFSTTFFGPCDPPEEE